MPKETCVEDSIKEIKTLFNSLVAMISSLTEMADSIKNIPTNKEGKERIEKLRSAIINDVTHYADRSDSIKFSIEDAERCSANVSNHGDVLVGIYAIGNDLTNIIDTIGNNSVNYANEINCIKILSEKELKENE